MTAPDPKVSDERIRSIRDELQDFYDTMADMMSDGGDMLLENIAILDELLSLRTAASADAAELAAFREAQQREMLHR